MCEDKTHMTTFDFDLNGTIIKWGCVKNKILKTHECGETAAVEGEKKYSSWLKQTVSTLLCCCFIDTFA
jgi:hypothetical protein